MEKPQYRCLKCEYEWEQVKPSAVGCPICLHNNVEWLNYPDREGRINDKNEG